MGPALQLFSTSAFTHRLRFDQSSTGPLEMAKDLPVLLWFGDTLLTIAEPNNKLRKHL